MVSSRRLVKIHQTSFWKMALANLEQMHPRYLMEALENGSLEGVLKQRVMSYLETVERLEQAMPGQEDAAQEIAQAEVLSPVNPNWQDEKPLTKAEKAKLKAFLAGLDRPG